MNKWWPKQALRINALSLRERLFLFISLIAICWAAVDSVWISPAQSAHKQALLKLEKQSEEFKKTNNAMKALGDTGGPLKTLTLEIDAVGKQIEQVNHLIVASTSGPVADQPLAQVLVHLLRRYEGLSLLKTSSMAPEQGDQKTPTEAASALVPGMTRQGLELTVSGPYAQLVHYLETLEAAMPHIRWGSMTLKSDKQSSELVLQLFIVGVKP